MYCMHCMFSMIFLLTAITSLRSYEHALLHKSQRALHSHPSRSQNKLNMKSLLFVILSALISLSAASITVGKCPVYGANNPDFDPTLVIAISTIQS